MAKNPRQKQKLLYIQKILLEKTDENHGLAVNEIISELEAYGITAERKSIYDDLRILETFGLDICSEKSKTVKYYIGSRDFQISELKLLVDAIQSSKFITEKKLQNQVVVSNRVKTANETIYYNVDRLHDAISRNRAVEFFYNRWKLNLGSTEKLTFERRRNGEKYLVSPWALCWDDENYYLIGFDEKYEQIRHYRVDKMEKIELTDKKRSGTEQFSNIDLAKYSQATFGMFAGESVKVTLSVDNSLVGVIADRFGKNIFITADEENENRFLVSVNVNISEQFFGWLFALGENAKLISPEDVVKKLKKHSRKVSNMYKEARV